MDNKSLNGKKAKVIFDDLGRAVPKIGKIVEINSQLIVFLNEHNQFEGIPLSKIIRIEVLEVTE